MWLAYPCIFCIPVSLHSTHPLALYLFAGTVNKSTRTDCHGQHSPTHISRWISRPSTGAQNGALTSSHTSHFPFAFRSFFFFFGCWQTNFKANAILSQVTETTPQPVVGFPFLRWLRWFRLGVVLVLVCHPVSDTLTQVSPQWPQELAKVEVGSLDMGDFSQIYSTKSNIF